MTKKEKKRQFTEGDRLLVKIGEVGVVTHCHVDHLHKRHGVLTIEDGELLELTMRAEQNQVSSTAEEEADSTPLFVLMQRGPPQGNDRV